LHGFDSIRCPEDYQEQVPPGDYESHESWITRSAAGEKNLLTAEPIRLFEPPNGSTTASKLIPYPNWFQQQVYPPLPAWIADLFLHRPGFLNGCAYWSVSPSIVKTSSTPGGILIGFENDAAYVGGWKQHMVESAMAVPDVLSRAAEIDTVLYLSLLFLL